MRVIREALQDRDEEVGVAVVGCGWWGSSLINVLSRFDGLHPRLLLDRDVDKCHQVLREIGADPDEILHLESPSDADRARDYRYLVAGDLGFVEDLERLGIDVVHEATGDILAATTVALSSVEQRLPFTTVSSEMDATIGLILARKAAEGGSVYTNSDGDQPGCLARMLDDILGWGFEARIVGNNKLFLDHYQTPAGVMPWVPDGGNPLMYSEAADGTKLAIELSVVANGFGFPPLKRGMYGPETGKRSLIETFDGLIGLDGLEGGHIDYTMGTTEPDMGGPVFVIAFSEEEHLRREMRNYKKGDGPYYLFFRDHHLGSMEAVGTIAKAVLFGTGTLVPRTWCSDVITLAKRDLSAGTKLDMLGGFDYFGLVEDAGIVAVDDLLPIGLARFSTIIRDIKRDEVITRDMVELDENIVTQLRNEQDRFLPSQSLHPETMQRDR